VTRTMLRNSASAGFRIRIWACSQNSEICDLRLTI